MAVNDPNNKVKPEDDFFGKIKGMFGGAGGGAGGPFGGIMAFIKAIFSMLSGGGLAGLFGGPADDNKPAARNNFVPGEDNNDRNDHLARRMTYGNSIDALAAKNSERAAAQEAQAEINKAAADMQRKGVYQGRTSNRVIQTPELRERQEQVASALTAAAKSAGISPNLMVGVWSVESTFSSNLRSPTGCMGPWQFERKSMVDRIAVDGKTIISDLKANGFIDSAARVENLYNNIKDMSPSQRSSYTRNNLAEIDNLRMDSYASTFAAAHHLGESARILKVNPHDPKNFGIIYAGYNVGPSDAKKMQRGEWVDNERTRANGHVAHTLSAREGSQIAGYSKYLSNGLNHKLIPQIMAMVDGKKNDPAQNNNVQLAQSERTGNTLETTPSLRQAQEADKKAAAQTPQAPERVAILASPAPSVA